MKARGTVLLAVVVLAGAGAAAWASYSAPRQYYSSWYKSSKSYYYRDYYYKPADDYVGYKHNYVIYYPDKPKYCYYYNPYKKVYWGRCPMHTDGHAAYSELAESDRKGTLADIPEAAFPPPGAMPSVPDSSDKVAMDLPPDDLPQDGAPVESP